MNINPNSDKFVVKSRLLFTQRYDRKSILTSAGLKRKIDRLIKSGSQFSMSIKTYDY